MVANNPEQVPENEFREIVKAAKSLRGVVEALGLNPNGGESTKRVARKIASLGLSTEHFTYSHAAPEVATSPPVGKLAHRWERLKNSVLVENSPLDNLRGHRKTLLAMGLLSDYCVGCGKSHTTSFGEEKKIPLQIDHINGNSRDNRPENLRHLCPTCHSLQPTEAGRKSKGRKRNTQHEPRDPTPEPPKQEEQGRASC